MSSKQTSPSSGKNKILYQVGARLEAMDYTLNWYAAKICRVDEKEKKVLIHFEGWNHRYDEWIAFDSERLRPHIRQQSQSQSQSQSQALQDTKDDKEVCDYQDWRVGDRVLAKWQDCKFYPAKIVKSLSDGAYEVLFYDGIKKVVHRVNIKPDARKMPMMPTDKLEHDREIQERRERRQLMATARAERARKRSADVSPTPPTVPVKRKDGRSRKGRTQERDEFGTVSESSLVTPSVEVPEVDEVSQDSEKINGRPKDGGLEAEQSMEAVDPVSEDAAVGNDAEKLSEEKNLTESTFTQITEKTTPVEQKQKHVSSVESPAEPEKSGSVELKEEKEYTTQPLESLETGLPVSEHKNGDSFWNVDTQGSRDLSIKTEENTNSGELLNINVEENRKTESVGGLKSIDEKDGRTDIVPGDDNSEIIDVKLEPHNIFPSSEENESSKNSNIGESNTSAELYKKPPESLESATVTPKLEPDTTMESKPLDSSLLKVKTSKGPKIKRTLSRAERLSRNRKAKTGLVLKMGFKGSPLKVSPPSKRPDIPEVSSSVKGTPPVKATVKGEKTVQRRKSSKGSRSSSISPRGYGYSMAFMDMDKPGSSVAKPETETEQLVTESGLTDPLKTSTQSVVCSVPSPTSPVISTSTPTESTPAPKKQTYQAKKFRLDQITGKLTAQRQSEAQAAAHSPSAFQLAKHSSPQAPPPRLTPSPPANPPPPYPRESYPPPGPPPLIYSPMPGSCCPTPHHQRMYGPHPGHRMHLPTGHLPPHPDYPPPSSGYMLYAHGMHYPPPPPPGPCIGQCSCSACVRQPLYHPLPPGAPAPPRPNHDSALAQLMQCEQRILHSAPGMAHYREAAPPGPWVTHRHGPPPPQPFIPVNRHHEDRWHSHEERALQLPTASQAPPPPLSISPTSESGKNGSRRSRKNERPLPTKALPTSTVVGVDAPLAPSASETDLENTPAAEKVGTQQSDSETPKESVSKPEIVDPSTQDVPQTKLENQSNTNMASGQLPSVSDQNTTSMTSSVSLAGGGTSAIVTTEGAMSGIPSQEGTMSLASLLPVGKGRKGKELAPKELVIEIDHNKYKCKVPGCDKSFRKESGLEYHVKYYHEQQSGMKRKKSISVRSDSTPETSPEFGSRRVTKRRIHRSSAPAQLSSSTPVTSPTSLLTPATKSSESVETEPTELLRSVSMDFEPSVNQDTDLEIDGGGVEVESIDPGMVESIEMEEEENVNGDVIRCLCNETEEGGFMIQCEQCLTWQHSECVGLSEQTVPPNYLCYVCTNPRGLRRSAKYKNDFDWFRRGTLACMPFVSIEEPEYNTELNLATHGLMGDLHDVNSCLRSLKLKFDLLRNPSHPDLKYWHRPKKSGITTAMNNEDRSSTNTDTTVTNSSSSSLNEQGQSVKTVSADGNGHAVINGHTEMGDAPQNGLVRVKQERPSTPPPSLEGPGDSNNNVHNKTAPLLTSAGSTSSTVPVTSSGGHSSFVKSEGESDEVRLNTVKKEEAPLSPIPALVPAGGQNTCIKSTSGYGKPETNSNTKSDSSQPSVKCKGDEQETGQPVEMKSSVAPSEVKPNSSGGSPKADCSDVKMASSESKPQSASDEQIKQENDPRITGGGAAVGDIKQEAQEESVQRLSDDEGVGAMNNLLGDITHMQDDLEERMDDIERQLTVLEEAYGGTPSQLTKKTDFRKLVKDLNRVRRILQQIS